MGIFGYIMAGLFVLVWAVLLYKLIRVVSAGRKKSGEGKDQD